MKSSHQAGFLIAVMLAGTAASCSRAAAPPPDRDASLPSGRLHGPERVTDHVWVMRQPDRVWSAVIGNVVIIEQSDGVILFDTGGSIADGRDIVKAVAKLTLKPVKAIVISHWHNDHPLGVPGILATFPDARVIATTETARMMKDIMGKNVGVGKNDPALDKARMDGAKAYILELEASARDAKLSEGERREFATEAAWIGQRVERQMGNFVAMPTETFTDRLLLDDPLAPVELLYLGAANTGGDLVAWLPKQRAVLTGDVVVAPSPYGFNSSIQSWVPTLEKVKALDFSYLVPGHGASQRDAGYIDTMIWSMRGIEVEVRKAIAEGKGVERALTTLDQAKQAERFGASSPWAKRWLMEYWLAPIADSIYREIKEGKVVEGG